jgi:diguanylate cyclase (GGDEF)-like protein/PAS domain S-box-containing protein
MQTRRPGRALPDGIAPKDSLPRYVGAMPHVHALRDADLFAALIENCPDVIFIKDTLGIYQACNHVAAEMLGRSKSEIIGKSDAELFPPDVAERHREMDRIVLDTQACHAEDQCQAREDGGAARTIEMMKSPLRRADGTVIGILGIGRDVTERRKLNESLRLADLLYRTTSEAILIIDDRDIVMDANPAFLRLLGYTLEEVVGTLPSRFVGASFDPARRDAITRTLERDGHWEGELRLFRKDGQGIDVYADVNVMFDAASNIFRRAVHIRDLTEYKSKDAQIWRQANFDQLTGLPNRSLLLDRLGQCMVTAKVSGCSIGLLCIDLDRFAAINGLMGHANGDAVLVQTARRVQGCLPEGATVARLASDRFAAFLAGPRSQLEQKAAVLIEVLAAPFQLGLETVHVTASIGMTVYPDDGADALALMNGAEQAIAIAKRAGGNRFQCFAPAMQEGALTKARLTHELRQAIDRGELHLYYQPIVNVRTGRIDKAEALLRWIRPVQGVIGPACFIPLAEEGGLIVRIGDWVIEQAIASVERWRRELGVDIELSVNQSPMQFDKAAGSHWMERLAAAELPPHSITVEITESMLVNDTGRMHASLSFLRANGAKVSLDDFGTGYSALSYLKRFDVDYLKIDKSFVQNIEQDADDCTLIQGIIELAHRLRIETIAEGVETRGQRDILTQSGCDYLQGYFYSRPVARDGFERMLEKSSRKKAFQ